MCWPRPMACRVRGLIFSVSTARMSSILGAIEAMMSECYRDISIVVLVGRDEALDLLQEC